jgi:glycine dehydrogenase subunit 1
VDIDALTAALNEETAAFYFENPCHLGCIETGGKKIAELVHGHGAECVVSVDPISLGVLTPPPQYGADIVCGDLQPFGMHMSFGGGHAGFIATRDEERYVMEYPSRIFGIAPTRVAGEYGFGDVTFERTSFAIREEGKEWVGTAAALWGITAGVYLALMGPKGMQQIGTGIMQRVRYAMDQISAIDGVRCPVFSGVPFKEFVVDFSATGKTVGQINDALYQKGIFGGYDLSGQFTDYLNCALFCETEVHTRQDMDTLAQALK